MCSALLKSDGAQFHGPFEASVASQGLGRAGRMHTLKIDNYPECTKVEADTDRPIPSSGPAWPPGWAKLAPGLTLSIIVFISELG